MAQATGHDDRYLSPSPTISILRIFAVDFDRIDLLIYTRLFRLKNLEVDR